MIRAKTGRVYGALITLLTILKGLPLTYNKDLQEDKEPIFDSLDTTLSSLKVMTRLLGGIRFNASTMLEAASAPYLAATDVADAMARQGIPFREAHARVGAIVRGESTNKDFNPPTPEEMVESRSQEGATDKRSVIRQIEQGKDFLRLNGHSYPNAD